MYNVQVHIFFAYNLSVWIVMYMSNGHPIIVLP